MKLAFGNRPLYLTSQTVMNLLQEADEDGIFDTFDYATLEREAMTQLFQKKEDLLDAYCLEEEEHPEDTPTNCLQIVLKPFLTDILLSFMKQKAYLETLPADTPQYLKKRAVLLAFVRPVEVTEAFHTLREEPVTNLYRFMNAVQDFSKDAAKGERVFHAVSKVLRNLLTLENRLFVTRSISENQKEAFLACLIGGTLKDFRMIVKGKLPSSVNKMEKDYQTLRAYLLATRELPFPYAFEKITSVQYRGLCKTLHELTETACELMETYRYLAYVEPLLEPLERVQFTFTVPVPMHPVPLDEEE